MAHQESDELYSFLLGSAQSLIARNAAHHPVGAIVNADGEVEIVAPYDRRAEPTAEDVEASIINICATMPGVRACGIAKETAALDGRGAIMITLEHRAGEAFRFVMPYERNPDQTLSLGIQTATRKDIEWLR